MRGCSKRESEIAREIGREKMNAGRNEEGEGGVRKVERL